ncbi:conserved hypothetical protein [Paenibacillus curdlanolyticus YK9]|uniref:Uncharacterized protein n=1 Tax=Paenibacillus curdlanolyticus YK9 TaxID=717606 RepID=E0IDR8_9BACL|nr:hypothetical protein [Paenibacillus curdlanolyticus]EFM09272.1 conserved hypothetical protein [Paenibacillus curdlanolyticus YK9]
MNQPKIGETNVSQAQGGATITEKNEPREDNRDNVYLFPKMLDHYQIQLTRMLEAEQYSDAKQLIRFLLQCRGEDARHYEEWGNLLSWLEMAFPDEGSPLDYSGLADQDEEAELRRAALKPTEQDEAYVKQVLYIIQNHPSIDQQMLALERAVHLDHPDVDPTMIEWLTTAPVHPVVQFKALQCLRRREVTGKLTMERLDEVTELDIELTPLALEDFPAPVVQTVERVESMSESEDPTLPHFARELWKECLQFLYGTSAYNRMLEDEEETIDCWAAALHLTLLITVYGSAEDDAIRDTYGISEPLRFRYEQACRSLRQVAGFGRFDDSPES